MFAPLLALALSFTAPTAEAGVYVNVSVPGITVAVNPWSPHWTPAPRAGYRWVAGHWEGRSWVPGYWVPTYSRAGYVWVPGYWDHMNWVEGYWRPASYAGYVWVEPAWYGGVYYAGGWVVRSAYRPGVPVYAYHAGHVRHERAENRHEQMAWGADERHENVVRHEAAEERAENRHEHYQETGGHPSSQGHAYAETGHQQAATSSSRDRSSAAQRTTGQGDEPAARAPAERGQAAGSRSRP